MAGATLHGTYLLTSKPDYVDDAPQVRDIQLWSESWSCTYLLKILRVSMMSLKETKFSIRQCSLILLPVEVVSGSDRCNGCPVALTPSGMLVAATYIAAPNLVATVVSKQNGTMQAAPPRLNARM